MGSSAFSYKLRRSNGTSAVETYIIVTSRKHASKLPTNTGGKMPAGHEVVVVLNKPTPGTKLARWPGPIRSPVVC